MKKTGALLKKTREAKGLSLHEIGLSLKINSKILKAIEDDDHAHLPAKTFLRGFVQSYAQYLKLDIDQVMTVFTEEMGSTRPSPYMKSTDSDSNQTSEEQNQNRNEAPPESVKITQHSEFQIKPILYGLVTVFLLVLILMVKKVVDRYQKEALVETIKVENPLPAETPPPTPATPAVTHPTPEPVSQTKEVTPTEPTPAVPTPEVIAAPPPTPPPEPKAPAKPTEVAKPVEAPKPVEPPKPTETTVPDLKPATEVKTTEAEKVKKTVELIVEAMDNVEIEYSSLAGKSGKIKLSSEQVHTFKSSAGLRLSIDNGGAVNLILNGKDLGVPGELGKPIRLNY